MDAQARLRIALSLLTDIQRAKYRKILFKKSMTSGRQRSKFFVRNKFKGYDPSKGIQKSTEKPKEENPHGFCKIPLED